MDTAKRAAMTIGWTVLLVCVVLSASAITGQEVLEQMEDAFSLGGDSSDEGMLLSIDVVNEYANGVSTDYQLAVAANTVLDAEASEDANETTYSLMYFLGGDDEGMIFLLHLPEGDDEDSRMWLYISSFDLTKELISDDDQAGRFAGSTLTYADIAGASEMRDEYEAELVREDTITLGTEERTVWVLELTPIDSVDAEYDRAVLWVDQEADTFLRLEAYDADGTMTKEIDVTILGTFEDRRVPEELVGHDLETGDVSTIRMYGMRRPDTALVLDVFAAENLSLFDPSTYGF
ncbi:outer membrane lipoprotein-sorting protein [Candidatus Bipolaricaulota bacterium]|nr:outer membrane lipoprotein-sorting protein [Candidatus Bipolaricaulota bacterium]